MHRGLHQIRQLHNTLRFGILFISAIQYIKYPLSHIIYRINIISKRQFEESRSEAEDIMVVVHKQVVREDQ